MPKVSVTIPTYNRAHFIGETIGSVLNQTFQDFEIVVVDDGSSDNTKEILDNFNDKRIKYTYQENQGVGAASKRCFSLATGEYVCFLHSDDVLIEGSIEARMEVLDKHPEASFVYGQIYLIDEKGNPIGLQKPRYDNSYVRDGILDIKYFVVNDNHVPGPSIMARRDRLNEIHIDTSFSAGSEDCVIWVQLARGSSVAYLATPVIKYRVHSSRQSTIRGLDKGEDDKKRILDLIFNDEELLPHLSYLRNKAYFNLYRRLSVHAYNSGEMKVARKQLYRAIKSYPRGFFSGLGLSWIYQMIKTWIPMSVIGLIRKIRGRDYYGP